MEQLLNELHLNMSSRNFCKLFFTSLLLSWIACRQANEASPVSSDHSDWVRLGPGGGGAVFIPTFSYFNPDQFFLRCDMSGAYLTQDGGISYHQFNFPNGASAFAFDPTDSNTIYAGSATLMRSIDSGRNWFQLFPDTSLVSGFTFLGDHANLKLRVSDTGIYHPDAGSIQCISIDPGRPATIYFAMGPWLYYSMNTGKTWKQHQLGSEIQVIYVAPPPRTDSANIFVFTADSLFILEPQSGKLISKSLPPAFVPAFSIAAGKDTVLGKTYFYALHQESKENPNDEFGSTQVIRSLDEGEHWEEIQYPRITNLSTGSRPSYSMVACAAFDARQAYLVCNRYQEKRPLAEPSFWYGVLKTMNGGADWDWVWRGGGGTGQYGVKDGVSPGNLNDAWVDKAFGGEYIRLMDVGVFPRDGNIAIITDWYRTMKTVDGGIHWNSIYSRAEKDSTFSTTGLDVTTSYGVHVDPFNQQHVAISYTDIGYHHSFNGGKTWLRSMKGIPSEWVNTCYWMVFDPAVPGKIWSAWSGMHDIPRGKMTRQPQWKANARGGVAVSVDSGKTWTPSSDGMGFDAPTTSIVMDPRTSSGSRTLYAAVFNKGVFKSTDDGKTWTLKNNGLGENTCAFELTFANDGTLYLTIPPTPQFPGGQPSREILPGAVYRSTDGAEHWTPLHVSDQLLFPTGMDVDPKNPKQLYLAAWSSISLGDLIGGKLARESGGDSTLGAQGGIFSSQDGGNSWHQIFDPLQYVYDVTVDPYHRSTLYCSGFNGAAYRSVDAGKTWKKLAGYNFHWGHRVIPDPADHSKIYLTTYGSSVWHGTPKTNP